MVFEQEVSFRINRAKKKGLRAKISQNGQFLLIKIFLNANFSSAWIVGRLHHTISESSGPDCSDEVSSRASHDKFTVIIEQNDIRLVECQPVKKSL